MMCVYVCMSVYMYDVCVCIYIYMYVSVCVCIMYACMYGGSYVQLTCEVLRTRYIH